MKLFFQIHYCQDCRYNQYLIAGQPKGDARLDYKYLISAVSMFLKTRTCWHFYHFR
jgi:hypothetical protein